MKKYEVNSNNFLKTIRATTIMSIYYWDFERMTQKLQTFKKAYYQIFAVFQVRWAKLKFLYGDWKLGCHVAESDISISIS